MKATQQIDSVDPATEHSYVLELRQDNTFSICVDGQLKPTDQNEPRRRYLPEAGDNPILSKLKTWITNAAGAGTEAGSLKYLSIYNCTASLIANEHITPNSVKDYAYMLSIKGENLTDISDKTFCVYYEPSRLEVLDLIGQTLGKELEAGTSAAGIRVDAFIPGVVAFTVIKDYPADKAVSGFLSAIQFKSKATGASTIVITY